MAEPLEILVPSSPDSSDPIPVDHQPKLLLVSAKDFLDRVSKEHKFSVGYSDFPKSQGPNGKDQQYFSLVTLGLEKPIVGVEVRE